MNLLISYKNIILKFFYFLFLKICKSINILFFNKKKYNFHGGIRFLLMKKNINTLPEKKILLGDKFFIYLDVDFFEIVQLKVKIGDYVLRGQELVFGDQYTVPIHASTSGTIFDIKRYTSDIILNKYRIEIFLIADGKDISKRLFPIHDYKKINRKKIIQLIYQNGISGLGGGQFSSARKLNIALCKKNIHTLIINALESEPYVTADNWLIKYHISEILKGCEIIQWILQAKNVIIAIGNNKYCSHIDIKKELFYYPNFQIRFIKNKYPSGSSKQLIKILTGKEIPHNMHSVDIGIVMYNVGTVYAIKRAIIEGEPLIKRVVTLTGNSIKNPGNMWVRLGMSINDLLLHIYGFEYVDKPVIIGGPLMGSLVFNLNIPILKSTHCILVPNKNEIKQKELEQSCIRCAKCSDACPMKLLPQQLYWYVKNLNHDKTKEYKIKDCIECGICERVCPSNIPLLKYYKLEKRMLLEIEYNRIKSRESKLRFQKKQLRENNTAIISTKSKLLQSHVNYKMEKICSPVFRISSIRQDILTKNHKERKKTIQEAIIRVRNKKINKHQY